MTDNTPQDPDVRRARTTSRRAPATLRGCAGASPRSWRWWLVVAVVALVLEVTSLRPKRRGGRAPTRRPARPSTRAAERFTVQVNTYDVELGRRLPEVA